MRGGRNKFGPMYKRDRARKLQMMRQKQIQRAQCQGVGEVIYDLNPPPSTPSSSSFPPPPQQQQLPSPSLYNPQQDSIKQEIQIPQLSSSTSSPDSSPSPLFLTNPAPTSMAPPPAQGPAANQWRATPPPSTGNQSPNKGGGANYYNEVGPLAHTGLFVGSGKVPGLVKEFQMSMPDDKDWQAQLFGLLQNQTYNQCEVDGFELMCKVIDQSLFAQVDWARNSVFFKELKVSGGSSLFCCAIWSRESYPEMHSTPSH